MPSALPNGKVTGLRARGGVDVDIEWREGKLVKAVLRSRQSKAVRVRYAGNEREIRLQGGRPYEFAADALRAEIR